MKGKESSEKEGRPKVGDPTSQEGHGGSKEGESGTQTDEDGGHLPGCRRHIAKSIATTLVNQHQLSLVDINLREGAASEGAKEGGRRLRCHP